MSERFSPSVRVPHPYGDYDYTPSGWEWILAFALGGCEWAIKEASKPEFRLQVITDLRTRRCRSLQLGIEERLKDVERLRAELDLLERDQSSDTASAKDGEHSKEAKP